MKSLMILLATLAAVATAQAHDEKPGVVVVSKAVELGVHRIERLVTLKKIDAVFAAGLYAMRAERTTDPDQPYKIFGYVLPDANNRSSTISMVSDVNGKVVSYSVSEIFRPAALVSWPIKDAATLIEDGLHFVLEGWVDHPEVKAFYLGLSSITLHSATDSQGNRIALLQVTSDDDSRVLSIKLQLDGSFISHEIK